MISHKDRVISESYDTLLREGGKRPLGIKRWDLLISDLENSGSVKIPMAFGNAHVEGSFYYVLEKVGRQRLVFVRPLQGNRLRFGECFGFYGFSHFQGYRLGNPIVVVEGLADWVVVRKIHPFALVSFHVGLSQYQWHIIRNLTRKLILAFDRDEAGSQSLRQVSDRGSLLKVKTKPLIPVLKDFGEYAESSDSAYLIERHKQFLQRIVW